jgi:alpha-mannosidase
MKRAHVFAYIMNNYWHTNYKAQQGGKHSFRFALTSNRGAFSNVEAVSEGWDMFSPPVAQSKTGQQNGLLPAPAASLITVEPATLPLMAFKQAEDQQGFVCRLCNFSGRDCTAKLTLPKPAAEVVSCNLVEEDPHKNQSRGQTVKAVVKPFGPASLKVVFAPR